MAYQVILEPSIGQFCEFDPPSAQIRGDFCAQIDLLLRKTRGERELATSDEKSTSSGSTEPYARSKLKARTGEKERYL